MTPDKLSIYYDTSPAVRLLHAANSPFILCFLRESFKRSRAIENAHSDLLAALAIFQERHEESGIDVLQDNPEEYLRDWSSSDKRWLRRFLESGRSDQNTG